MAGWIVMVVNWLSEGWEFATGTVKHKIVASILSLLISLWSLISENKMGSKYALLNRNVQEKA